MQSSLATLFEEYFIVAAAAAAATLEKNVFSSKNIFRYS